MIRTKLACLFALSLLAGCGGGSSDAPMMASAPMAARPMASGGQVMVTENDITDRPYRVLGDVSVSVKKSAMVDTHVQGKVIDALIDKASGLGADAVILVRYSGASGGFDFGSFSMGEMGATGRAVTFKGVNESMSGAMPAPKAGEPQLPSQTEMKSSLLAYFSAINAGDVAGAAAHYADDATIEDPVGTPVKHGKAEIQAFIGVALSGKPHFEIQRTIRGSNTNVAAVPLRVTIGKNVADVIEIYTFNRDGRFSSMKAIFGSDDRVTRP